MEVLNHKDAFYLGTRTLQIHYMSLGNEWDSFALYAAGTLLSHTHTAAPRNEISRLTTGIGVEEPDWSSYERTEHPVVQHSWGIDTDEVKQSSTDKVEEDRDSSDATIDAHTLVVVQVADGLYAPVAHLEDGDVEYGAVRPTYVSIYTQVSDAVKTCV